MPDFGYQPIIGIPYEIDSGPPEFAEEARKLGYQVELFAIKGAFDFTALRNIRNFVKKNNISIVHSHGYREDLYALAAKKTAHIIATNHLWKRTTTRLKVYAKLDAIILRLFKVIIAVSKPVLKDMTKEFIPEKKITLIPNGIDPEQYTQPKEASNIRADYNIPEQAILIGTLSSLTPEKGIRYAIEALHKLKQTENNYHLLITGSGKEKDNLVILAKQLDVLDNITFLGTRTDINQILHTLDIFLLPSLIEGLPMALLEAMASGRAVVATTVGDIPTLVTENNNGILVPTKNSSAIKEAIEILATNNDLREVIAEKARLTIINQFSSLAMTKKYVDIYDQVTSKDDPGKTV